MEHNAEYFRKLQERERLSGPHSLTFDEMDALHTFELAAPDLWEAHEETISIFESEIASIIETLPGGVRAAVKAMVKNSRSAITKARGGAEHA